MGMKIASAGGFLQYAGLFFRKIACLMYDVPTFLP
jgi:hypothetical protein